MPEEDVVLRFSQQGAAEVVRSVEQVQAAFRHLGGPGSPSVGFVQMMSRETPGAIRQTQALGQSITTVGGQFRLTGRIIGGLAGTMAGELTPALGKVGSGLASAAGTALMLGGALGVTLAAVQLITGAITDWVNKSKEAEEFQIRLTRAFKTFDVGTVLGQIDKLSVEMAKSGGNTEENRQKMQQLQETFAHVWKAAEEPKLLREQQVARLGVTKQQVQAEIEQAAAARDQATTEADRSRATEQMTEALQRQIQVVRELAAAQAEAETQAAQQRAAQLRLLPGGEAAAQLVEQTAQARAAAARAAGEVEAGGLAFGFQQREAQFRTQQAQAAMEQGLALQRTENERRQTLMQSARTRELADLEVSNRDARTMAEDRARVEERYIVATRDARMAAIAQEHQALQAFGAQYPQVREIQEQVDRQLMDLQRQRLQAEVEADNAIIQQRQQMIQKLRDLAVQEAAIGGDVRQQAAARLQQRGVTRVTREQVEAEVGTMRGEAAGVVGAYRAGAAVDPAQLQQALQVAGLFARMVQQGTTAPMAMGQELAQAQAGLAGRAAPTVRGGGLAGIGAFDPGRESFEMYSARLELAAAREQQGLMQPRVTAGMLRPEETMRLDQSMKQVEESGNRAIENVLERMPPIIKDMFQRFVDEFVRRVEQEAQRT